MSVCRECCVLSGRRLCDELITRPKESYRLWCVVVCDLETSWMRRPWHNEGCCAKNKQTIHSRRCMWKRFNPNACKFCILMLPSPLVITFQLVSP
jgi:hypothetical protein